MKMRIAVTAVFVSAVLCGCALRFKDVSNDPEYSHLLNTRYALTSQAYIYGINLPPGYGKDINVYSVYPIDYGRISGPEILSEEILKPGTVLEIQRIEKSINHLPHCQRIQAVVTVTPYKKVVDVPVETALEYLLSTNYVNKIEHLQQSPP